MTLALLIFLVACAILATIILVAARRRPMSDVDDRCAAVDQALDATARAIRREVR